MDKQFVEVLRGGINNEFNLLNENDLENVFGGKYIHCLGGYSGGGVTCPTEYTYDDSDDEDAEMPNK